MRDQPVEEEASEVPEAQVEPELTPAEGREDSQASASVEPELTPTEGREDSQGSTLDAPSEIETETPSTSHPPSEVGSTKATSPSSAMPPPPSRPAGAAHTRTATKPVVPLIPIRSTKAASLASTAQKSGKSVAPNEEAEKAQGVTPQATEANGSAEETPKASPQPKAVPKSWAELLRAKNAPVPAQASPSVPNGVVPTNGPIAPKSNSLSDVLASFSADADKKVSFLEPRGLVNSGNICYMNSVGIWCQKYPFETLLTFPGSSSPSFLRPLL
jgi:ubiquitin carboxyl-terminal hydrolase 10